MVDLLRWPVRVAAAVLVCGPLLAVYWTTPWELTCLAVAGVLHVEVGLRLWRQRPDGRMGPLLVACGLVWLLDAWGRVALPAVFAGGLMLSIVHDPMHLHAGLVVTSGRLRSRWDRTVAAAGYAYWPVLACGMLAAGHLSLAQLLHLRAWTYPLVGVFLAAVFIVRYRRAGTDDRHIYAPFWAALAANGLCTAALSTVTYGPGQWPTVLYALGAALIPMGATASSQRAEHRRLRDARDRERRRVERDVHDGVQQRLLAAAMMLRQDDPTLIARGAAEVDNAIADLRDLVRGMNPVALVCHGLSGAVAAIAERARVPVTVDDRVAHLTLPEPVAATAYYVTMEAVANSEKHAHAGLVTVTITTEDDRIEVTVRDDGVGGALAVPGGGLQGLRERVESCGGTLRVSSARGRGTAVRAVLPLGAS
ncbi:sensor histidine kinase [Catellatospora sichuanensis]|uniref:sensor histidine kinase n=1 Tax=Catellatospora sichuanensis TaxID=1969805 RepID=UPI001182A5A9|nr:ATP-binding protein [Catellatospora sichuanensis]